jgi:hypothetical protein
VRAASSSRRQTQDERLFCAFNFCDAPERLDLPSAAQDVRMALGQASAAGKQVTLGPYSALLVDL